VRERVLQRVSAHVFAQLLEKMVHCWTTSFVTDRISRLLERFPAETRKYLHEKLWQWMVCVQKASTRGDLAAVILVSVGDREDIRVNFTLVGDTASTCQLDYNRVNKYIAKIACEEKTTDLSCSRLI